MNAGSLPSTAKKFDREEYLREHLPYRMQAVAKLDWALSFASTFKLETPADVAVGGKRVVIARVRNLTNPMIEVGLVYVRVLMEFLGLQADKTKIYLKDHERGRKDSVYIEDFFVSGSALPRVTRDDVVARHPKAEISLVCAIAHADKAICHLTLGPQQDEATLDQITLASRIVPLLIEEFFYGKLGLPVPPYKPAKIRP